MHFNENANRAQAATSDGQLRYAVTFTKAKKGEPSVKAIKSSATFGKSLPYFTLFKGTVIYYGSAGRATNMEVDYTTEIVTPPLSDPSMILRPTPSLIRLGYDFVPPPHTHTYPHPPAPCTEKTYII